MGADPVSWALSAVDDKIKRNNNNVLISPPRFVPTVSKLGNNYSPLNPALLAWVPETSRMGSTSPVVMPTVGSYGMRCSPGMCMNRTSLSSMSLA